MNNKNLLLITSLATGIFSTAPAVAASKDFPTRISGVWVGSGTIRKSPSSPRERVRCRMSSKWQKSSGSFSLRYICLGIDIKFETSGTLKYSTAKKTISGRLVTVGIGAFRASGRNRGNSVFLSLSGRDKKTGKPAKGSLSLRLSGSRKLSSSLTATDSKTGKRFKAFSASFKR